MYQPIHEARDEAKLSILKADMLVNGWTGAALVADGLQLLTGAHRFAAAQATDTRIETIDIRDLFEAEGLDFDAVYADAEGAYGDYFTAVRVACDALPASVREEYGIDIH